MESLFAQFFLALQEHIKAVPSIRWVDQDLGQLEFYDQRPAVSFPCVLIDLSSTTYEQMQLNQQWGNLTFTLRLGFAPYSPANSAAPISVREKALEYYEVEHELYKSVQGFDASGLIQPATRVSAITEQREGDNHRVRVITFTTSFQDETLLQQWTKQKTALEIEQEIAAALSTPL